MRGVIQWFAEKMEDELRENDPKGGWHGCSYSYLCHKLLEEVGELVAILMDGENGNVTEEAADIANYAMMIADNACGPLPQAPSLLALKERRVR